MVVLKEKIGDSGGRSEEEKREGKSRVVNLVFAMRLQNHLIPSK